MLDPGDISDRAICRLTSRPRLSHDYGDALQSAEAGPSPIGEHLACGDGSVGSVTSLPVVDDQRSLDHASTDAGEPVIGGE